MGEVFSLVLLPLLNATTPQRTKQVRTKGNTISSIRACACHKSGIECRVNINQSINYLQTSSAL